MKQVAANLVQGEVFSRVMEITAAIRRSLAELTRDEFERLRKTEMIPSENLTGLQLLREKAANERNLRELYRDRAPFELIQNADDAGATKAAFVICADGFAFGHNGSWFTVENFRSLAEGWSNKRPGECIGHKGLGFRSVLDVSPSPVLGRIATKEANQFAVKFSWKNNHSFIERVLARTPELKVHYASWTRNGQSACPVMAIPSAVRPDTLGGGTASWQSLRALGHTTVFWLPAADPDLPASAASHLGVNPITSASGKDRLLTFLEQEMTVVLPFLRTLRSISVLQGKGVLLEIDLQEEEVQRKASYWCRTSRLCCSGISTANRRMFQVGTRCSIPPYVKQDPHTPVAARNLADIAVTLAVELVGGEPSPSPVPFYVYFPTEDRTGVGFVVHADFHVEPHRKHLMLGAFNSWIYKEAAKLAAGPFLTELLARFSAKAVFNVQGPVGSPTAFLEMLGNELRARKLPFVPTKDGLVKRDVALLAPNLYQSAYFEGELAEALALRRPQSRLLSAEVDCARTRAFLELADIEILDSGSVIELIEDAAQTVGEDTGWWLRAYSHLALDPVVSCYHRGQFVGKRLVPGGADVLAVPAPTDPQLCLPPTRVRTTGVPAVFSSVFCFVNPDLADQLDDTDDSVAAWVRDRFAITRFEASELLPRAIRAVNPSLFSRDHLFPREQLVEMWRFVQALATTSRMQSADDVWTSIGRLPLLVENGMELPNVVNAGSLAPAFLLYWPDDCVPGEAWIQRLQLPRASSALLLEIIGGKMTAEWSSFFHNVGVSIAPKLLEYSRVPGLGEVPLSTLPPSSPYTGERQRDENAAVLRVLRESKWWRNAVSSMEQCGHTSSKVLHSIHVIDGLSECSKAACQEHTAGDETWRERLLSLARRIAPFGAVGKFTDSAYCRGRGGHNLMITPAVRLQLDTTPWLPSSRGPATSMQCFLRQSMHRVISGTSDFGDLTDAILPFVVTDDLNLFSGLARAGIRTLESVRGASPEVLTAAMNEIGAALSTDWGRENVLTVAPRWRAVRGTLQDIFRALNQFEVEPAVNARLLPVRTAAGVEFRPAPFWYADPGALRDAFTDVLPLLDADRAYQQTFRAAGVQQLVAGDSVIEELTFSQQPVASETLRSALVDAVGPYLLAMIASRSDSEEDRELSSKRLRERFSVSITPVIQLAFVLASDQSVRVEYSAGKYYLQRRLVARRGAVEEAQFTLYVAHSGNPLITELDADAIGMHLAQVLQDRPSAELAASCARIATRFKEVSGDTTAMKEFMYNHLQVSIETQDDVVPATGYEDHAPPVSATPPPIIISGTSTESDEESSLAELLQRQQVHAANEATELVNRIVRPQKTDNSRADNTGTHRERNSNGAEPAESITEEQAERGRRGEEEMKRRLTLPGGWAGFVLKADVRSPGCGYDFVAGRSGRETRIEVKTFTANGRIMFTSRELKEAAIDGASYFLVGLLDDGGPEKSWRTYLVQNPLVELLRMGFFTFEARLQLDAEQLCALAR